MKRRSCDTVILSTNESVHSVQPFKISSRSLRLRGGADNNAEAGPSSDAPDASDDGPSTTALAVARLEARDAVTWSNYLELDEMETKANLVSLSEDLARLHDIEPGYEALDFGALAFDIIKAELLALLDEELQTPWNADLGITKTEYKHNWTSYLNNTRTKVRSLEFGGVTNQQPHQLRLAYFYLLYNICVGHETPYSRTNFFGL